MTTSSSATKPTAKPSVKLATQVAATQEATKPAAKKPAKPSIAKDTVAPVSKTVIATTEKDKKTRKAAGTDKSAKVKKPKLVRDSFTIPKNEYQVIDSLKQRSAKLGHPMKKSELLRAGIKVLNGLGEAEFKAALADVPAIKTGRPKSAK